MIFMGPTHQEVVDHILKMGYVPWMGPMDLGERIWELPYGGGGVQEGQVKLLCCGDTQIEEEALARIKEAENNLGAGI